MTPSAHLDTFARDNLPPRAQWPDFLFGLPELNYPDRINCAVELLDRRIEAGDGDRPCLISPYGEPQLCATGGAGEPHRQRAHARPRSPARAIACCCAAPTAR